MIEDTFIRSTVAGGGEVASASAFRKASQVLKIMKREKEVSQNIWENTTKQYLILLTTNL